MGYWIVFYWLFGSLLWVCHKYRVNLAVLFDLPSDYRLDYRSVLSQATGLSILWCVNFLLHLKMVVDQLSDTIIPESVLPMALLVFLVYRAVRPWGAARFWAGVVWRVVSAPFSPVTFVTVYVGDVMTSFTRPFNDFAFTLCYFFSGRCGVACEGGHGTASSSPLTFVVICDLCTGFWVRYDALDADLAPCVNAYVLRTVCSPLLSALPLWFRFLQCLRRYHDTGERWPHLGNAGKYALSMTVALIGLTLPASSAGKIDQNSLLWIVLLIMSTCYTFSW
jgi:hypothetical protein